MKGIRGLIMLILLGGLPALRAQLSETNTFTAINLPIPDDNPAGVQDLRTITSGIGQITSLRVRLKIVGGFNGDLYAYLSHGNGLSVLLNRPGRTATDPYGYPDSGFDVVFSDSAQADIHDYELFTRPTAGSPLSGSWQPDARFIDPESVTDSSIRSTMLNKFSGLVPAGDWILFLADLDPGGLSKLDSWALEITGIPKAPPPVTWANPAAITYGTALSAAQLNATASAPGTFYYSPPAGTVLDAGTGQVLSVVFIPNDTNTYLTASASVILDVLPHPLIVAADNQARTYGTANPPLTGKLMGVTNGDNITTTYTTAADTSGPAGSYAIVPVVQDPNGRLSNYMVSTNLGTLQILRASLIIAADDQTAVYGAAVPRLTWHAAGFVNGDTPDSALTGNLDLSTPVTPFSAVNTYPIVVRPGDLNASNYTFSFVDGALRVTAAPLIGRADNQVRFYGQTNPLFTVTYSGFVNGEDASLVSGTLRSSCPAQTNSPIGVYPIQVGGQTAPNYTIEYLPGSLWVQPSALLIQANDASRAVGETNPVFTATFSGFVNGEDQTVLGGTLALSTPADTNSPAGTYPIVPEGLTATNYTLVYSNGTLRVAEFVLVVGADDQSRAYGSANPVLTGSLWGLQPGDQIAASFSTAADTNSPVGSYPIVVELADPEGQLVRYSVRTNTGLLTVTPAPLVVEADNQSRGYGATNPGLTGTLVGLQNGDNISPSYWTAADPSSPVGVYSINVGLLDPQGSLSNYTVTTNPGTLTIGPASLVASADNQTRAYGGLNPALTGSVLGLQNGDNISATFATAANPSSPVGIYSINVGLLDSQGSLSNYTVTTNPGTLTIGPASLVASSDNQTRAYGAFNPALTGSVRGLQNGDNISATFATAANPSSPVGIYSINVGLLDPQGSLSNYTVTTNPGTLTIGPASLVASADNQTRAYGAFNPALTGSIRGLQNGDNISATFATAANPSSRVGVYSINVGLLDPQGSLSNYTVTTNPGTLTIGPASLVASADNQVRFYGQTNPLFTVTYSGFVNGEDASLVSGTLRSSCPAQTNSPIGVYPIQVGGQTAPNYTIEYLPGSLWVQPSALLIQANDASRAVGETNPVFTATFSGFVNGEDQTVLGGTLALSTPADTNSPAGTYPIVPEGLTATNYTLVYSNGTLRVAEFVLVVGADDQSRAYGSANPVLTGSLWGLQPGDQIAASFSTAADTNSPVGSYPIVVELADPEGQLVRYSVRTNTGLLTVTPAPLVVEADNQSRGYGATNPGLTGTLVGLQNGDNISPSYWTAADPSSPVGVYSINVGLLDPQGSLSNYTVTTNPGTLTIGPAPLVASADNQTRAYGGLNPALTGSVLGLQNGDNISATFATAANPSSPVGIYSINVGLLDSQGSLSNYTVTTNPGTLTIGPASLVASADNQTRAYGAFNPALTGSVLGLQNGDNISATFATAANPSSPAGPYPITASLQDPGGLLGNYALTLNSGTLMITQALPVGTLVSSADAAPFGSSVTLTLSFAPSLVGGSAPSGSVQFWVDGTAFGQPVALVSGSASINADSLQVGSHSVSAVYAGDNNYSPATFVLALPQVIRTAPFAADYVARRAPNHGTKIPISDLERLSSGGNHEAIVFDSASGTSTGGGTIQVIDGWLLYEPPAGSTNRDDFNYATRDTYGALATGTITIVVDAPASCQVALVDCRPGTNRIVVTGIPWECYAIEYAADLALQNWNFVDAGVADSQGHLEIVDGPPQGTSRRFYRALYSYDTPGAVVICVKSSANLASPGTEITFTASVFADDPGLGVPSGAIQFQANGADLGVPVPLSGGVASFSTNALPTGTNTITVRYGGDGVFVATAGALNAPQMIITPPVAGPGVVMRPPTQGVKMLTSDILANDTYTEGDPVVLTAVSPTSIEGGQVILSGNWVFYTPPAGYAGVDSFTYTIQDTFGFTAVGTVTVEPLLTTDASQTPTFLEGTNGIYRVIFTGIPWQTYTIQSTTNPAGTNWLSLITVTADSWGHFEYDDALPTGDQPRSYRAISDFEGPTASPFRLAAWTNFITQTNSRTMDMWAERSLPPGWPDVPPLLAWNTNCLLYGWDGFTAISQCNEWEGALGQVPITLLTRRHGYTRGHGSAGTGFYTQQAGQRVWFCTASNTVVEMTVAASLVRLGYSGADPDYYDYSLVVFSQDVPESITPISVLSVTNLDVYYSDTPDQPALFLGTEQLGHCAAQVPPFVYPLSKPGDSGSPNMIPAPDNKLIMVSGRTTSGPSAQMQADIDTLSNYVGISTNSYQLRWYDMRAWGP